jgi:TPR repeat protein
MRWLRKAADQGNEVAQRSIGMIYLQALGVPQDRAEAIRWFRKAAANGDEDAKSALEYLDVK